MPPLKWPALDWSALNWAALLWLTIIWAALTWSAEAFAQAATTGIEARLSAPEISAGMPVELSLTATSSDGDLLPPDLAPLEADFQILDRRVERQMSTVNGERRERLRLRLLLLPRRPGALEVPPITFGAAASQPLSLLVNIGTEEVQAQAPPGDPASLWTPPPPLWSGPPAWSDPLATPLPPSLPWPDPKLVAPGTREATAPASEPERPDVLARTLRDPWFWAALVLGIGLWWSLRRGRAGVVSAQSAVHPPTEVPGAQPDPLTEVLDRLRAAYASGDARAARLSLLAWGKLRWPHDPPGNLARLAQRCPTDLAEAIQQLEKAFFSPTPIPWQDAAVAEGIERLDPPAEKPATEPESVV